MLGVKDCPAEKYPLIIKWIRPACRYSWAVCTSYDNISCLVEASLLLHSKRQWIRVQLQWWTEDYFHHLPGGVYQVVFVPENQKTSKLSSKSRSVNIYFEITFFIFCCCTCAVGNVILPTSNAFSIVVLTQQTCVPSKQYNITDMDCSGCSSFLLRWYFGRNEAQ